jgi:poly(3-hydroxybutyrate) depolymerase
MLRNVNHIQRFFFQLIFLVPFQYGFAGNPVIIDSRHYSLVFGETRNFRIFLPPGYYENPGSKYPVIYYYHGWSQRYFGSTSTADRDEGESNNGDNIANYVASHNVIVVKADGYNHRPREEYYLRPYNISPVETYRQFPLYFPELVNYIDANYNTIPDRNHRAISGLSMGGFMTFWISGKYPDLVCAAGNFCGSPEFEVGPENFPVEYRHIDMRKNYAGVHVRLNYGNRDFIRCYHRDMNRIWPQVMDNYEFKVYDAEHTTCGLGEMFDFIMNAFAHPLSKPEIWDHIDVYPEFEVWDYQVSSDRDVSGFTILENVGKRGFRCSVREFLPDGELIPSVNLSVTTAPVYKKDQSYVINDIDKHTLKITRSEIRTDSCGRLRIKINGSLHEIGINEAGDSPLLCVASAKTGNMPWAVTNKEVSITVRLLNKGLSNAEKVSAVLSATRNNAKVLKNISDFGTIPINSFQEGTTPFTIIVNPDTIEIERFKLTIRDESKNEWIDYIEIPIRKELPVLKQFEIADGKMFTVSSGGVDSVTLMLGSGNGDGIANPGESIVVLAKEKNKYWRTELYTTDPFINSAGINIRLSDNWGNYDHVGGSAKYSVPLISSDCPQNHTVDLVATWWLPDYPEHLIQQGKIFIKVTGKDLTPPVIRQAGVSGDNTVEVKAYDGSVIKQIKARFTAVKDPSRTFEVVLNDEGREGDRVEKDLLFSKKMPEQSFGLFNMEIETVDSYGNTGTRKADGIYVFH